MGGEKNKNRNEQSKEEKKRGKKAFWREGLAGEQDWPSGLTVCRGDFFFFWWRSAKPTDTVQVSSALKKALWLLQEGCRDNVV